MIDLNARNVCKQSYINRGTSMEGQNDREWNNFCCDPAGGFLLICIIKFRFTP